MFTTKSRCGSKSKSLLRNPQDFQTRKASQLRLSEGVTPLWEDLVFLKEDTMSWTWRKGYWGEDPVYRFKPDNFFQSGRHKVLKKIESSKLIKVLFFSIVGRGKVLGKLHPQRWKFLQTYTDQSFIFSILWIQNKIKELLFWWLEYWNCNNKLYEFRKRNVIMIM